MARAYVTGAVLGLAVAGLAGCGGESSSGVAWQGTVDTVEGVAVVANPAEPMLAGEDAWWLEEDLDIGVFDGDPDYQFASIADLVVGDDGDIYVLDRLSRRVMIYDSTGAFLHGFGRQGEGPGEFESPAVMFWQGDTLVIWDWRLRRLSYFDGAGELLRDRRVEIAFGFRPQQFFPSGKLLAQVGPVYSMPIDPESDGVGLIVSL